MRYLTLLIKSNLVETPMVLKTTFCVLLMFVSGAAGLCAEAEVAELAAPGSRMFLRQGWKIQSSAKVPEKGSVISTVLFQPKGWYPTDIPSTVLAALVRNHVYPNPDFGMNLRSIPAQHILSARISPTFQCLRIAPFGRAGGIAQNSDFHQVPEARRYGCISTASITVRISGSTAAKLPAPIR